MKKWIASTLALVMAGSALAGCGSSSKEETKPAAETTTAAAGQETKGGETAAGQESSGGAEGDITSWILEDDTSIAGEVNFWIPLRAARAWMP